MFCLERIQMYLSEHGITQAFIARKIGINPKKFNRMLLGYQKMDVDTYAKICDALQVSMETFIQK